MELKDVTLEMLKAERPELVESAVQEAIAGLESELATAQAAIAESARTGEQKPAATSPAAAAPGASPEALAETDRRLGAAETELARYRGRDIVAAALRESGLAEASRALVESHFAGAVASDTLAADVKAEIERVKQHDKALVESVRAPGVGFMPSGAGDAAGDKFNLRDELREVAGLPQNKEEK